MIDMIMNLPFRQTTMKYFMKKMLWLIIVPNIDLYLKLTQF